MAFKFILSLCAIVVAVNAGDLYAPAVLTKVVNPAVDAVATTQQNVVRTFAGTVSTDAKQVSTPYSSFSKVDSRTTNNVYTPAVAKTVTTYAAPVTKTYTTYAAPVAKTLTYAAPATKTITTYAAPAAKTITYAAPTVYAKSYEHHEPAPVTYTQHSSPVVYAHAAPAVAKTVTTYAAPAAKAITYAAPTAYTKTYAPAPLTYTQHSAPVVYAHAAPAVAKTVTTYAAPAAKTIYTPAPTVAAYTNTHVVAPVAYSQPLVKQAAIAYSPAVAVSHVSFDGFGTHWGF